MLSCGYFFRGNYMSYERGLTVVQRISDCAQLTPQKWGMVEPLNLRFDVPSVARCFLPVNEHVRFIIIFLVRTLYPRFLGTMSFSRGSRPFHNQVNFQFDDALAQPIFLASHIETALQPAYPDYAFIAAVEAPDVERFAEAHKSIPAREFFTKEHLRSPFIRRHFEQSWWFTPHVQEMRGPHGWLWDVVWYNFFGKVYVDFIGRDRLTNAGWSTVKAVGDGLACYATDGIDDANSFEKRTRIRSALSEFYWSPGCAAADKRAPVFDFSEQIAAPPESGINTGNVAERFVVFAGFTEREEEQAIRTIESETGMKYDPASKKFTAREDTKEEKKKR